MENDKEKSPPWRKLELELSIKEAGETKSLLVKETSGKEAQVIIWAFD